MFDRAELLRVYGPHLSTAELQHLLEHAVEAAVIEPPMRRASRIARETFRRSCEDARAVL